MYYYEAHNFERERLKKHSNTFNTKCLLRAIMNSCRVSCVYGVLCHAVKIVDQFNFIFIKNIQFKKSKSVKSASSQYKE